MYEIPHTEPSNLPKCKIAPEVARCNYKKTKKPQDPAEATMQICYLCTLRTLRTALATGQGIRAGLSISALFKFKPYILDKVFEKEG